MTYDKPAQITTAEIANTVANEGWSVVGILDRTISRRLLLAVDEVTGRSTDAESTGELHLLSGLAQHPDLAEVVDWPPLLALAVELLSPNIYINHSHLDVHPPHPLTGAHRWHRDNGLMGRDMRLLWQDQPRVTLKVAVYLTDVESPDDGALEVVPHSHLDTASRYPTEAQPSGVPILGSAGTVAVFDARFVIGAGHAFANVAVRALTLRSDLKQQLIKSFTRGSSIPTFVPFSQKPVDWVSLNKEACKNLVSVAQASGSENIVSLVAPVVGYGRGSGWRALVDRRGEDFHRWRPQTHGLQGIPPKTPWRHTPPSAGSPGQRVLPLGQPVYEDARGLADEVARVATDGMFALADAMDRFMDGWTKTSHELGGPTYKSSD